MAFAFIQFPSLSNTENKDVYLLKHIFVNIF